MNMKEKYFKEIRPALAAAGGYKNTLAAPRVTKVTLNIGINSGADVKIQEVGAKTLMTITGQKPVATKAKKSISNFKIREGMVVGLKVTLRGQRLYDFLEKLVRAALPRIRDFRGLSPKLIDKQGNLSIGFKEHTAFPEINPTEIDRLHGLEVVITTTAKTQAEGLALFRALGFPFREK